MDGKGGASGVARRVDVKKQVAEQYDRADESIGSMCDACGDSRCAFWMGNGPVLGCDLPRLVSIRRATRI